MRVMVQFNTSRDLWGRYPLRTVFVQCDDGATVGEVVEAARGLTPANFVVRGAFVRGAPASDASALKENDVMVIQVQHERMDAPDAS